MRKLFLLLFFLGVLNCSALTLEEAYILARDNYPIISDYQLIRLTADYTIDNISKIMLPQVVIGVDATWQTDVVHFPDVLQNMFQQTGVDVGKVNQFQWKAYVDVTQTIWDGGQSGALKNTVRCEAVEDSLTNELELYRLKESVDELYFSILLLANQQQIVANTIELLETSLERVNTLLHNGVAMLSDADAVEVELLTCQQQQTSLASLQNSYRQALSLYIGNRAWEDFMEPEFVLPFEGNNAQFRPEVKLIDAAKSTIDAKKMQLRASIMPQIGAFVKGYYGYPGMNFMSAMMNNTPTLNAILGISVSWNLGSLYTKSNKEKMLEIAGKRMDVARDVFNFNLNVQADRQRNELNRLFKIAEHDEQIVLLRGRVRAASEARLNEGIVEPTDLLLRVTEEKNAAIAASQHKIEYLKALYKLKNIFNE